MGVKNISKVGIVGLETLCLMQEKKYYLNDKNVERK